MEEESKHRNVSQRAWLDENRHTERCWRWPRSGKDELRKQWGLQGSTLYRARV